MEIYIFLKDNKQGRVQTFNAISYINVVLSDDRL